MIPVRCYECGKCISTKYGTYRLKVIEMKKKEKMDLDDSVLNLTKGQVGKTIEGRVMDDLGIIRLCCRKIFLGHIEY